MTKRRGPQRFARPRAIVAVIGLLLTSFGATLAAQEKSVNQAIDRLHGDHSRYEQVIRSFQTAVAYGDSASAAKLVRFPIRVAIGGKPVTIANAQEFVRNYDRIITPAIAGIVTDQKYDELMVNAQGVMFGNGQVWVNGVCLDATCRKVDVKVAAIQEGPK